MMELNDKLKIQAYVDGELGEPEAHEVARWLAEKPEASVLASQIRSSREALANFEEVVKVPESRDFYWSKIQRRIESVENQPERAGSDEGWLNLLRRWLAPATVVAVMAITALVVVQDGGYSGSVPSVDVETALNDTGAFTYRDFSAGATLVWLSYPAEN